MSLLLIMLGAGLVFSLTSRCGAAFSQTQPALFFLPPAIVAFVNALRVRTFRAAGSAPKAVVSAWYGGRFETVGLP